MSESLQHARPRSRGLPLRPAEPGRVVTALLAALLAGCVGNDPDRSEGTVLDVSRNGSVVADPIPIGVLSLTFEDGPSPYSRNIIDMLAAFEIQATFFWVGAKIDGNRDLLAYARDNGHQVANHSYYHDRQVLLDRASFVHRLRATKANIGDFDNDRLYFRFPYGESSPELFNWLRETRFAGRSYVSVGWDVDSSDWDFGAAYPEEPIATSVRVESGVCNGQENPFTRDFVGWTQFVARKAKGGVMLFHDIQRITRDHLGEIITFFKVPSAYWDSLDEKKRADYRKYYACTAVDPDLAFTFSPLYAGEWPTLVQKGRGPATCASEYVEADYPPKTVTFQREIKGLIERNGCANAGCHNEDRLSSYSALSALEMLGPGTQARTVGRCDIVRGKPEESYLLEKLSGAAKGARMPLDLPPLSDEDMATLTEWIRQGAPDS